MWSRLWRPLCFSQRPHSLKMALQSAFVVPLTTNHASLAQHTVGKNFSPPQTNVPLRVNHATEMLLGKGKRARRMVTKTTRSPVTSLRAFENDLGVQAPVGFWDPLGYAANGDIASFKRRRETELKHGRISMLATMGYMTPEIIGKWPGYCSPSLGLKFEDIPNGLAALKVVPAAGWVQIGLHVVCGGKWQ